MSHLNRQRSEHSELYLTWTHSDRSDLRQFAKTRVISLIKPGQVISSRRLRWHRDVWCGTENQTKERIANAEALQPYDRSAMSKVKCPIVWSLLNSVNSLGYHNIHPCLHTALPRWLLTIPKWSVNTLISFTVAIHSNLIGRMLAMKWLSIFPPDSLNVL